MTQNQIAFKRAEEEERANKAKEDLGERSSKRQFISSLVGSAISAGGRIGSSLLGKRAGKGGKPSFERGNDPQWYLNYQQLAKDAASLSFLNPLGDVLPGDSIIGKAAATSSVLLSSAGIMVLPYVPEFGDLSSPSSVANQIALRLYSYVRHANSGSRNYDVPDLMQYVLAVISAMEYVATLRNMYGIARKFSVTNKFKGKVFLKQFGIDPDEIYENLADFRYKINTYVLKLQSFAMPTVFQYLTRHLWLNEHVWLDDSNEDKAQAYVFMPAAIWRYDPKYGKLYLEPTKILYNNSFINPKTGAMARYAISSADSTETILLHLQDLYDQLDGIIDDLLSIEDIGIMSGDILKAFDKTGLFQLYEVAEDYVTDFAYSKEVLSQINNITPRSMPYSGVDYRDMDPNGDGVTTAQVHGMLHTCMTQTLKGIGEGKFLLHEPSIVFMTEDTNDIPNPVINLSLFTEGSNTNVQNKGAVINSIETITPSVGDVLVMTRGANSFTTKRVVFKAPISETYSFTGLDSYGSEIFLYPYYVTFANNVVATTNTDVTFNESTVEQCFLVPNNEAFQEEGNGADWGFWQGLAIAQFKWHPVHRIGYCAGSRVYLYDSRDVVNASFISASELKKLHYVAITSLFMIPEFKY